MVTTIESEFGLIDIEAREALSAMSNGSGIFDPAIRGVTIEGGNPVIVLAMEGRDILTVTDDGKLVWVGTGSVQLDWRYDYKTEKWVDASGESLEIDGG